jgi:hypothetical protein
MATKDQRRLGRRDQLPKHPNESAARCRLEIGRLVISTNCMVVADAFQPGHKPQLVRDGQERTGGYDVRESEKRTLAAGC